MQLEDPTAEGLSIFQILRFYTFKALGYWWGWGSDGPVGQCLLPLGQMSWPTCSRP